MRSFVGMLLLLALMGASLVPGSALAEPSGPPILEIEDVRMDLIRVVSGEFATGEHILMANLSNIGDTSFNHEVTVTAWATDPNGAFVGGSERTFMVAIAVGETIRIDSAAFEFSQGTFDVGIKVTFGGTTVRASTNVTIRDVIDLSITDVSIDPDQEFKAGSMIEFRFDVLFVGNVGSWAENVTGHLGISNGSGIEFESEINVMESHRKPIDPPHVFNDLSFETWIPSKPGKYTATISLPYPDDIPQNNTVTIPIKVFVIPSIRGSVVSRGEPVRDAVVALFRDGAPLWANRTDPEGMFEIFGLGSGYYWLNVSHDWADPVRIEIWVKPGKTTNVTVELEFMEKGNLEGFVEVIPYRVPAPNAKITIEMKDLSSTPRNAAVTADEGGYFFIPMLDEGEYTIIARHPGYGSWNGSVTIVRWTTVSITIEMTVAEFRVLIFDPANGTLDFPVDGNVTVEFSRSIDPGTIANITIRDMEASGPVPARYDRSEDGTVVRLDPISDLLHDHYYMVLIYPSLRASNGDPIMGTALSEFFTEGEGFPVNVSSDPEPGETGVLIWTRIEVTFSERIDPDTIDSGSFMVRENDVLLVPGTYEISTDGRTASFEPNENLKMGTRYVVELTDAIRPMDTFSVFTGQVFDFFTMDHTTPGSVKGRLFDPDGNPLTDKRAEIRLIGAGEDRIAYPDDDGWFSFEGVRPGVWSLEIVCPGYEKMTRSVEVRPGETYHVGNLKPQERSGTDNITTVVIVVTIALTVFAIIFARALMRGRKDPTNETPPAPEMPPGPANGSNRMDVIEGSGVEPDEEQISGEFIIDPSLRSVDNTLLLEVTGASIDASEVTIEMDGAMLDNPPGTIQPFGEYRVDVGIEVIPGDDYLISVAVGGVKAFEQLVKAQP